MLLTKGCYQSKRYYLATSDGDPYTCFEGGYLDNEFSAPPGMDSMGQWSFGNITVEELIIGSVRTLLAEWRNRRRRHSRPRGRYDPRGPLQRRHRHARTHPLAAPDHCGVSTFVDQKTSDASLTVSDYMQIVKNIANTDGKWEVENAIGSQYQLVQYGSCADTVDIITDSVKQFGGSGNVGSKAEMSCSGNVKSQKVEWGLYHD
ncbi:hypothetical protein BDW59DRAFT_158279 [Aspergillus cavernicola]|uniref:Ecp2 effector protein-like domain-containing protein n=1 Tax=Aspergillus cavernicola TaxID=176166 RepID=A0ABR4ISU5_9EURO